MVSIDSCPACGSVNLNPLFTCIDFTVTHESFSIYTCQNCKLGITTPRPDDSQIEQYYLSEEYISHSGTTKGIVSKLYLTARKFTLRWKRRVVQKYCKQGLILDYGCGTGEFLKTMKSANWNILGVEPSSIGREKASKTTGETIYSDLKQLNQQPINAITLWHVFEHIPDLNQKLSSFRALIDVNGYLFVAVPNYQSADAKHYKENWAGYDVPRHLWHFTKESMERLLEKNEFELTTIIPMKLDAYYVSLLSERNKKASFAIQAINGFTMGMISNLSGRKTLNHSSLIYIARPK